MHHLKGLCVKRSWFQGEACCSVAADCCHQLVSSLTWPVQSITELLTELHLLFTCSDSCRRLLKPILSFFCTNWGMSDVLERFCCGEFLCGFKEETSLMRINWGEFGSSCFWSWAFRTRLCLLYELPDLKKKNPEPILQLINRLTDYSAF